MGVRATLHMRNDRAFEADEMASTELISFARMRNYFGLGTNDPPRQRFR